MEYKPDNSLLGSKNQDEMQKINQLIEETKQLKSKNRITCYILALLCLFATFGMMALVMEISPVSVPFLQGAGSCGCFYFIIQAGNHHKSFKKEKSRRIEKLNEYISFVQGTGSYAYQVMKSTEKLIERVSYTPKQVYSTNTLRSTKCKDGLIDRCKLTKYDSSTDCVWYEKCTASHKTIVANTCKAGYYNRCKLMTWDSIYGCLYYKECNASFKTVIIDNDCRGNNCWGCVNAFSCKSKYKSNAAYLPPPF
jgi:hypothetical protein